MVSFLLGIGIYLKKAWLPFLKYTRVWDLNPSRGRITKLNPPTSLHRSVPGVVPRTSTASFGVADPESIPARRSITGLLERPTPQVPAPPPPPKRLDRCKPPNNKMWPSRKNGVLQVEHGSVLHAAPRRMGGFHCQGRPDCGATTVAEPSAKPWPT